MNNGLTKRKNNRLSYKIVNSNFSLDNSEIDIVLSLLTTINKDDIDFKDYTFTLDDLEIKLNKKIQHKQLQKTISSIVGKPLKIEIEENHWKVIPWFSYFEYNNGLMTCSFDKRLKPYLLELKSRYVESDLKYIMAMKSVYSKRIYLLLKEHKKFGYRKLYISELMDNFQVPKTLRKYSLFKIKVLNQAVKDINKFTDLEIVNIGTMENPKYFEEHKMPRKVDTVTFKFKRNLIDLNVFIKWIRDLHTNEELYTESEKSNRIIQCSTDGLLYYKDNQITMDKDTAMKCWEWLYDNRLKLYIHKKPSLQEDTQELSQEPTKEDTQAIPTEEDYLVSLDEFRSYVIENHSEDVLYTARNKKTKEAINIGVKAGELYNLGKNQKIPHKHWEKLYELAKNNRLEFQQYDDIEF